VKGSAGPQNVVVEVLEKNTVERAGAPSCSAAASTSCTLCDKWTVRVDQSEVGSPRSEYSHGEA
jgi:hypothetical protein